MATSPDDAPRPLTEEEIDRIGPDLIAALPGDLGKRLLATLDAARAPRSDAELPLDATCPNCGNRFRYSATDTYRNHRCPSDAGFVDDRYGPEGAPRSDEAYRAGYSDGLNAKLDTLPIRPSGDEALRAALDAARTTLAGLSYPLGAEAREWSKHERDTALHLIDAALAAPVSPSPDAPCAKPCGHEGEHDRTWTWRA